MRIALSILALAFAAAPLTAQQHADHDRPVQGGGTLPEGWSARTDNGGPLTNLKYEVMAPGFHLTTGPASILYRNADRVEGPGSVVSKIHLFPSSGHHEGFGLFLGGQDLAGDNVRYTYFLIRGDGKYLIKRRNGSSVSTVVNWTDSDAITKAKADGPVANELSFTLTGDSVAFLVNGKTVHTVPASEVDTRGVAGLRVNHNLNLHVETLAVKPR